MALATLFVGEEIHSSNRLEESKAIVIATSHYYGSTELGCQVVGISI